MTIRARNIHHCRGLAESLSHCRTASFGILVSSDSGDLCWCALRMFSLSSISLTHNDTGMPLHHCRLTQYRRMREDLFSFLRRRKSSSACALWGMEFLTSLSSDSEPIGDTHISLLLLGYWKTISAASIHALISCIDERRVFSFQFWHESRSCCI